MQLIIDFDKKTVEVQGTCGMQEVETFISTIRRALGADYEKFTMIWSLPPFYAPPTIPWTPPPNFYTTCH